jgi:hypothetical protein
MMQRNMFYGLFIFLCIYAHAMQFIDSNGKKFQLSLQQKELFCASDLGKQLQDDIDNKSSVDFSDLRYAPLKGQNILAVLSHADNPGQLTLTDEVLPEEIQLLETANVLGLPNQACARHLAARLWPVIQNNGVNPLQLSEGQKQGVRALARPYAPCPAHMLEYLKNNAEKKEVQNGLLYIVDSQKGRLNLSHTLCQTAGYKNRFGTLNGLEDLVRYLLHKSFMYKTFTLDELYLDGHMLNTFSLWQIQSMNCNEFVSYFRTGLRKLSMRKNCMSELSEHQLDCHHLPTELLDLSDNPICIVTDGAFGAIKGHRAGHRIAYDFQLKLENNLLSEIQKKELQKKFYNATHTIPERWTMGHGIAIYKYVLAIAPLLCLLKDPAYFEEPNMARAAAMCIVFVWWWYLFVNRFDMRLAQLSHPTMGQSWGGDFHDRSWAIWPKNNALLKL